MGIPISKYRFSSPLLGMVLITVTVAIIYSNIYYAPFVYDDLLNIVEMGSNSSNDQVFKRNNIVSYYSFAINYKLCGLNVVGYHVVNVLVHLLNGFLVYFFSLTIFKKLNDISCTPNTTRLMSLFAALIFVSHPVQTEAVTYTIQRISSMAAMFYMAAVFFYLKARIIAQEPKHKAQSKYYLTLLILSGLCGISAFLSKRNAASLPGAIMLVEYLLINRTWHGWKKIMPWYAFSFTLWVVLVLYVSGFFSGGSGDRSFLEGISSLSKETITVGRWQYLCTQFNVLVIYIRLLFLPINQSLDYAYSFKSGFLDGYTPLTFSFLVGLITVGVLSIKKSPVISLAIFWFFITLSVESSIIPIRDAMYEHRLYLPMFGFSVFVSWLLFYFLSNKRSWVIFAYVVIVVSLGVSTYHRNKVWQDEATLWSDVLSKNPKNSRAHNSFGNALSRQNKVDEAIVHYKEALRINPNDAKAHFNLGSALSQQKRLAEAILHYEDALLINPDYAKVHYHMGNALLRQGKIDEAILHYKEALRINPFHIETHNNLGFTLAKKGKVAEAILYYKDALRINPNDAKVHYNLGSALFQQNNLEETVLHYKEALRIDSNYAEAYNNLGNVLSKEGKLDEAVFHYKKAMRINPNYAEAYNNLGNALLKQDKDDQAVFYYKEALSINPGLETTRNNLAVALEKIGKNNESFESD